jgi:hypothetical protein
MLPSWRERRVNSSDKEAAQQRKASAVYFLLEGPEASEPITPAKIPALIIKTQPP